MKLSKKTWLMIGGCVATAAIIIAVICYIVAREVKEAVTHTSVDINSANATTNMNIEHDSRYNQSVRGYRNNNPLNIRISSNAWKGKIPEYQNTDHVFEQLQTMGYGFRAALKNIQTYINKYGCNTIATICNKWAPASDGNDPAAYANNVSQWSGIGKNVVISANDKVTMCAIVHAMARMENGSNPHMDDVYKGWEMI